jgi:hypothetical protein
MGREDNHGVCDEGRGNQDTAPFCLGEDGEEGDARSADEEVRTTVSNVMPVMRPKKTQKKGGHRRACPSG